MQKDANSKKKQLHYQFKMQYCPGKWHRGPDACSRNPTQIPVASNSPTPTDISNLSDVEDYVFAVTQNAVSMINHNVDPSTLKNSQTITLSQIRMVTEIDSNYSDLITVTKSLPRQEVVIKPQY